MRGLEMRWHDFAQRFLADSPHFTTECKIERLVERLAWATASSFHSPI